MKRFTRTCLVVVASSACLLGEEPPVKVWTEADMGKQVSKRFETLGAMKIDDREAEVVLLEYEKVYQMAFVVGGDLGYLSKVTGSRFQMWILTSKGGALPLLEGPESDALAVAGNDQGGSANATFMFQHAVERGDVAGVACSIDGEFRVLKMPKR